MAFISTLDAVFHGNLEIKSYVAGNYPTVEEAAAVLDRVTERKSQILVAVQAAKQTLATGEHNHQRLDRTEALKMQGITSELDIEAGLLIWDHPEDFWCFEGWIRPGQGEEQMNPISPNDEALG